MREDADVTEEPDVASDAVDEPVELGSRLSIVCDRYGRTETEVDSVRPSSRGREWVILCAEELEDEAARALVIGKRMRFGAGEESESKGESGLSTVMPVVLGDSGEAIIGAGKVWRLNKTGVRSSSDGV